MAVGIDNTTSYNSSPGSSPLQFSHAGASSGVRGVVIFVLYDDADAMSSLTCTYGGKDCVASGLINPAGGDPLRGRLFHYVGGDIPQGTQTVSVTFSAGGSDDWHVAATTLTGDGPLSVIHYRNLMYQSTANPSISPDVFFGGTIDAPENRAEMGFGMCAHGYRNVPTAGSGTTIIDQVDFGNYTSTYCRTTSATDYSPVTLNLTCNADDWHFCAIAITDASIEQSNWRFRDDDGSESAATWLENAGADHTFTVTSDEQARIRFSFAGMGSYKDYKPQLEFSVDEDAWAIGSAVDSPTDAYETSISVMSASKLNDDGTAFYVVNKSTGVAYQYTLGTAYDLSTAYSADKSFDIKTACGSISGNFEMYFKPDGTKMYAVISVNDNAIFQFALSTAWDLSTASYESGKTSSLPFEGNPYDLMISDDGLSMWVATSAANGMLQEYSFGTAWDASTVTYVTAITHASLSGRAFYFSNAGRRLFIHTNSSGDDDWWVFGLSTAWDISTAVIYAYFSDVPVAANGTASDANALAFKPDGTTALAKTGFGTDSTVCQINFVSTRNWYDLPGSQAVVRAFNSTYLTDAGDTTQQITSGSFVTPNSGVSETGIAGTDSDMDFINGYKCEAEYTIEFIADDVEDADTIWFRVKNVDTRVEV